MNVNLKHDNFLSLVISLYAHILLLSKLSFLLLAKYKMVIPDL